MEHRLRVAKEPLFSIFRGWKILSFLSQKNDGNICIDYWKVLVLDFSGMGNTVFFWDKKLMKRWYLLIMKCSYFELFGEGKYGLFWGKKLMEDDIYKLLKSLVLSFSIMEKAVFCRQKVNGKMILVFLSFPWYSRTWEIRFFVQWKSFFLKQPNQRI